MWKLTTFKIRHLVVTAIIFTTLFFLLQFEVRSNASYQTAEEFLNSDSRVAKVVGQVNRTDFKFWEGFHLVGSSMNGEATYTFGVDGSKGSSTITMNLRNSGGTWAVINADAHSSNGNETHIVGTGVMQDSSDN